MDGLFIITAGQTDVQLADVQGRHDLDRSQTAVLHTDLKCIDRWSFVKAPVGHKARPVTVLPAVPFTLCTPKLDAMIELIYQNHLPITHALIIESRREKTAEDPHFAGGIIERRLVDSFPAIQVIRAAFLEGDDTLESRDTGPVIRPGVIFRIRDAIRDAIGARCFSKVIVAATGGMRDVTNLVEGIALLYTHNVPAVFRLDVKDGSKSKPPAEDKAFDKTAQVDPVEPYRARRLALDLVEKGNFIGAWGAVQHLSFEKDQNWFKVLDWLNRFSISMPLGDECRIDVLKHKRLAVKAAMRVELALRAGDVPHAVHKTVAFFECAIWDHLGPYLTPAPGGLNKWFDIKPPPSPSDVWKGSRTKPGCPFSKRDGKYRINDMSAVHELMKTSYLNSLGKLAALHNAVDQEVRDLRNDVSHTEADPDLMAAAGEVMERKGLWVRLGHEPNHRFLESELVKDTLSELGIQKPERLCDDLIEEVCQRLLQ